MKKDKETIVDNVSMLEEYRINNMCENCDQRDDPDACALCDLDNE